jgi:queuine tRNA-ribosyltransferase
MGCDDLERAGVQILMANAFHLMLRPGIATVRSLGGLHSFLGWQQTIATDSGGFQAYSLIRQNKRYGHLDDRGLTFIPEGSREKLLLTPEKAIQNQLRLGSDLLFCLDDCTHPDDDAREQSLSVERTMQWARACRSAFDSGLAQLRADDSRPRPMLYAVIQGGRSESLRRQCAQALLEIGFDGFGYGGWPIGEDGHLLRESIALTRELIPREFPMHALGIGHPASVVECARMGYSLFDSALPTRDARRGRLYAFRSPTPAAHGTPEDWLEMVFIEDDRYWKDSRPVSETCTGICCTRYSRGYLRHLKQIEDGLYSRLATIHNLTFMTQLTAVLRTELPGS